MVDIWVTLLKRMLTKRTGFIIVSILLHSTFNSSRISVKSVLSFSFNLSFLLYSFCCSLSTLSVFHNTKGLFIWSQEDPSTGKVPEGGTTFHWVYMGKFCGYQVERELVMAGKNNKNAMWALLLSLLALITTF